MTILNELLKLYGLAEVSGARSNPELLAIMQKHFPSASDDSTLAWCGLIMGESFKRAGFEELIPENYLSARSWLKLPNPVTIEDAEVGDVVIFWRGSVDDWRGHVALFVNELDRNVHVLGGNQGDRVGISPYSKDRILGIRKAPKRELITVTGDSTSEPLHTRR